MGKCLVTKYAGTVNNDNLPRFACIDLFLNANVAGNVQYLALVSSNTTLETRIEILDGPGIISSVDRPGKKIDDTHAICPSNDTGQGGVYLSAAGIYKVRIYNYYYLYQMPLVVPTTDTLCSLDDERLQFMKDQLRTISFSTSASAQSVTNYVIPSGSINSLDGFALASVAYANLSGLTGNIKNLFDSMYAAGRKSGTCRFDVRNSNIDSSTMPAIQGLAKNTGTVTFSNEGWTQTA